MSGPDPKLNAIARRGDIMARGPSGWGPVSLSFLLAEQGDTFVDSNFSIIGNVTASKKLVFQVDTQGAGFTTTFDVGAQTGSRMLLIPVLAGTDTIATLAVANNFSAAQTVSNATDATTIATGALIVSGGVGITKALWVGGLTNIAGVATVSNNTASTTSATGALVVTGGAGIGGAVFTGGSITMPNGNSISTAGGINLYGDANQTIIRGRATSGIIFQTNGGGTNAQMTDAGVWTWQVTTDATALNTAGVNTPSGMSIAKTLIAAKGQGWGVASTVTATGTTTLVQASAIIQTFTGTAIQTIVFPAANLWGAGIAVMYVINNQSSLTVTPTRAGSDTFQGGGTTSAVLTNTTTIFASDGVSVWLKVSTA